MHIKLTLQNLPFFMSIANLLLYSTVEYHCSLGQVYVVVSWVTIEPERDTTWNYFNTLQVLTDNIVRPFPVDRDSHEFFCRLQSIDFDTARFFCKPITWYIKMHYKRTFFSVLWRHDFFVLRMFIPIVFIFKRKVHRHRAFCLPSIELSAEINKGLVPLLLLFFLRGHCLSAEDKIWSGQIQIFRRKKGSKLSPWR